MDDYGNGWGTELEERNFGEEPTAENKAVKKYIAKKVKSLPTDFGATRCEDCGEKYNKFASHDLEGKRCNKCL